MQFDRPRLRLRRSLAVLLATTAALGSAVAQSNVRPGTDVRLGQITNLRALNRTGGFPNGENALSMNTTSCNVGSVEVPWESAMDEDHPFIGFLIVRESNGRLEQISNYAYVKHGFLAVTENFCGTCQNPMSGGTTLGINCSDTYTINSNGNNYHLGPAEEIDPWLGSWSAQCSHFDRGMPPVPPPFDCDGFRSFTQGQASSLGPIGNRIRVLDQDLDVAGAEYAYQAYYVVRGEPRDVRANNIGWRATQPSWSGSKWNFSNQTGLKNESILHSWAGADFDEVTNGFDDGRGAAAAVVTDLGGGLHHYEYALHNIDNQRAIGGVRIPLSPGTTVSQAGFRDIDTTVANDWTITQVGDELIVRTTNNPVLWNSIYNIWFDADTAPASGAVASEAFFAGAGQDELAWSLPTPTGGCAGASNYCTAKTGTAGCTPTLSFSGTPSLSSATPFQITATGVLNQKNGILFYGYGAQALPFGGGFLCVASPIRRLPVQQSGGTLGPPDCTGTLSVDFNGIIQGGTDPALTVGASAFVQAWNRDPNDPAGAGFGLSDGAQFAICP